MLLDWVQAIYKLLKFRTQSIGRLQVGLLDEIVFTEVMFSGKALKYNWPVSSLTYLWIVAKKEQKEEK